MRGLRLRAAIVAALAATLTVSACTSDSDPAPQSTLATSVPSLDAYCEIQGLRQMIADGDLERSQLPDFADLTEVDGTPRIVDFTRKPDESSAQLLDRLLSSPGLADVRVRKADIRACMKSTTEADVERSQGGPGYLAAAGSAGAGSTGKKVCNLVSPALASEVVGDDAFRTSGSGAIAASKQLPLMGECTISRESGVGAKIQVNIGDLMDANPIPGDIATKGQDVKYGTIAAKYDGDPGDGYGMTYQDGIWALGASVNVVRDRRIIRVTVYQWADATDQERLDAAKRIAADADQNLTTFAD